MPSQVNNTGKLNILASFPRDNHATMHYVGEQMDDTRLVKEHIRYDVPGDSQGGPQGDPIEIQLLAYRCYFNLNLSKYDAELLPEFERHGIMATEGAFADNEIGCMMLRDHSIQFVLSPSHEQLIPADDILNPGNPPQNAGLNRYFHRFPCCIVNSAKEVGLGTKFSALSLQIRAFRVPEGHTLAPPTPSVGLIYDRDQSVVPAGLAQYLPQAKP